MPIDFSFIQDNAPQIEEPKNGGVNVTLRVDADCSFKCDGEEIVPLINANNTVKVQLPEGQHFLEFISVVSEKARIEKIVEYDEVGKNYIEIIEGLSELVAKLPISDFIRIENFVFSNTDKDGKIIDDYGSELVDAGLKYLKPRMNYSCKLLSEKELTIYKKIIRPDGKIDSGSSSPDGYTSKETVTLKPGENNQLIFNGWGKESGGSYSAGKWKYQLWYNGTMFYETTFVVKSVLDYISVSKLEFANENKDGKIIGDYGSKLRSICLRFLKPRMNYSCKLLSEKELTIYKKIIRPDGTVKSGSSSPDGYTSLDKVIFKPGENNRLTLRGWGNESGGSYSAGKWKYQLWYNGTMFYETTFEIYY